MFISTSSCSREWVSRSYLCFGRKVGGEGGEEEEGGEEGDGERVKSFFALDLQGLKRTVCTSLEV